MTEAAREAAALKAEFRREDEALREAGRGAEIRKRNAALFGIDLDSPERPRLVTINGVRIPR
ncbi:MAG: hypothetical protein ACREH8_24235 [Opitutaceae bacterium]